ncbi:MAG: hypothetical protein SOT71_08200 [Romboutsia timonensis]|uniref:hypothetical protein n=1 Tax=Romboutsia timonensis TaxID=1776391 RepID=UPI002A74EF28|nr:hypothetical protein [Romboutsia timonensis]MDY2882620.1 hypothetical protein [Romboutsia timonensis]
MKNKIFKNLFSSPQSTEQQVKIANIKFPIQEQQFCFLLTKVIYKRILIDVIYRLDYPSTLTQRFIQKNFLFFNQDGSNIKSIIDLIASAIANQTKIYLIYNSTLDDLKTPLRLATPKEQIQMDKLLQQQAFLPQGQYIFNGQGIDEAILINALNQQLYNILKSTNSQLNASACPVFKFKDLTRNVALSDQEIVQTQAQQMEEALKSGNGIFMDADSAVDLLQPRTESEQTALNNYIQTLALISGLPSSYISGILTSGSYNGGSSDSTAIDRALTTMKLQIIDPIIEGLFDTFIPYKRDKWIYLYKMNGLISTIDSCASLSEEEKIKYIKEILP